MERRACITCEFTFEASHQLYRDDWSETQNSTVFGDCTRLHGHTYRLLVSLRGAVEPDTGMVLNFRDVKRVVEERVLSRVDHRHLNDVVGVLTTAENILYWIARQLLPEFGSRLHRVELWETRCAFASLEPEDLRGLEHLSPRYA